jgi:hypothetical protein
MISCKLQFNVVLGKHELTHNHPCIVTLKHRVGYFTPYCHFQTYIAFLASSMKEQTETKKEATKTTMVKYACQHSCTTQRHDCMQAHASSQEGMGGGGAQRERDSAYCAYIRRFSGRPNSL